MDKADLIIVLCFALLTLGVWFAHLAYRLWRRKP